MTLIILCRVEASWISEVESKPSSKYVNSDSLKVGEFILFSLQSDAIREHKLNVTFSQVFIFYRETVQFSISMR